MEIEKLRYNIDYKGGLVASVDWIAGGNFDGYLYKTSLRFLIENNTVIKTRVIIDKSRYDDEIYTQEELGTYSETSKATITCIFDNYKMRGKILGEKNQFIAFSVIYENYNRNITECYEISQI